MNNHGFLFRELGLARLADQLVRDWIDPLAKALLPAHVDPACGLDSHKTFSVLYTTKEGGDRDLSVHHDNAEVTFNINIGGQWQGGELVCFGISENHCESPHAIKLQHCRGFGILHAGAEQHQADSLLSGWRENLIFWCRSSNVRNRKCPRCGETPRLEQTCQTTDEGF